MSRRRRTNPSLTAAICLSLVVHAGLVGGVCWWLIWHVHPSHWAKLDKAAVEPPELPPPPLVPPLTRRRPKPPPRPPSLPFERPPPTFKDDSGEHDGHGAANRSTPGERPMVAPSGPVTQADLSRSDPADTKLIDQFAERVAQAGQPVPSDAIPLKQTAPRTGVDQRQFVDRAPADHPAVAGVPRRPHGLGPLPTPLPLPMPTVADEYAPPAPSGVRQATAVTTDALTLAPPARQIRGRLATASDTDSMALSAQASDTVVTFHAGQVEGRRGKRVRLVDPVFGLSSSEDLYRLGGLHAVIGVRVRTDGTPIEVRIIESSGSESVDEDCKRAMWYSTFEADTDPAGHPVETVWNIVFN